MSRFDQYASGAEPDPDSGGGALALVATVAVVIVGIIAFVLAINFATSFKSVDSGEVCIVKEGGPLDGRNLTDVRQPGTGLGSIGIFNDQLCLPTTERDSNDVLEGSPEFPTRDSVKVIADAQILFRLTTDPAKVRTFVRKYGRRTWRGHEIFSHEGFVAFLKERFSPAVMDSYRETLGSFECTQLNNLCQYVQQAEQAVKKGAKSVDTSQNLARAQSEIAATLKQRLHDAFGDEYFEDVRVQNLRIRFEGGLEDRIREAQSLRTQNANAALAAKKAVTEAHGRAKSQVAEAEGQKKANIQKAIGLKAYAKALKDPRVAKVEQVKALCGVREDGSPTGCQNLQVLGSGGGVITNLGAGK